MDSRRAFAAAATITPNKFFSGTINNMVEYTKVLASAEEEYRREEGNRAETGGRVWIGRN